MQDQADHNHSTIAGIRVALLLLAVMLTCGCASTDEREQRPSSSSHHTQVGILAARAAAPKEQPSDIEPTVVAYDEYKDPLIRLNRAIFAFNDVSYRYVFVPLGKGYIGVVPDPVQQSISNFFYNVKTPIYLVNNGLQLKGKAAGTNLLRFCINTTLGILGLFDPAQAWFDIDKAETSFADTLAHYGAGYGIYIVIPFLGPSDMRSGASALTEHFLNPIPRLTENPDTLIIQSLDYFQEFAPEAERYGPLTEESDDPYIFLRNLYLQGVQRDAAYPSN